MNGIPVFSLLALLGGALASQEAAKPAAGDREAAATTAREYAQMAGLSAVTVGHSEHYTVVLPEVAKRSLPSVTQVVDRYHAAALKGVGAKSEGFWSKRPVVIVFTDRSHFASFVRRVEKRSFEPGEKASITVGDEQPAIGLLLDNPRPVPPGHPPLEVQVGERVASAVFSRAAGAKNPVSAWLPEAFGTATTFQMSGQLFRAYQAEVRRNAQLFGRTQKENPWDAALSGPKGQAAQASFAYWLAYGPKAGKMAVLVKQFTPEENQERVELPQAMQKAQLDGSDLATLWQGWLAGWR